jgi:hypothetical protein
MTSLSTTVSDAAVASLIDWTALNGPPFTDQA